MLSKYLDTPLQGKICVSLSPHCFLSDAREMSLFKVLDNCKTTQGHRLLKQWIRQPFIDVNKIGMIIAVCAGLCMYLSNRGQ